MIKLNVKRKSCGRFLVMGRAGIPLGLETWTYLPLFKTYLESLGQTVVINKPTNKSLVELGSEAIVDETCLPCKIEAGAALILDGQVDYIFLPRLVSIARGLTNCPKMISMPDLLRARCKSEVIDPTVDIRRDPKSLLRAVRETGELFTRDGHKVYEAWQKAVHAYRCYKNLLKNHLMPKEAIEVLSGKKAPEFHPDKGQLKIALIGHNYNLNDSFSSFNLVNRLREKGLFVYTPDALSEHIINRMNSTMEKQIFWIHERKILGAAFYYIRRKMVDGIISVTSFNCGTSAVTNEFIGYEAEKAHIPLLSLIVDEHTAEAGVKTRLEAFANLMKWKHGGI